MVWIGYNVGGMDISVYFYYYPLHKCTFTYIKNDKYEDRFLILLDQDEPAQGFSGSHDRDAHR